VRSMLLTEILHPSCVKVPLESTDKDGAIRELVDLLDQSILINDKETALDAIFMREQMRSTGIGSGIAIPHGKCNATKQLEIAIGITSKPMDFGSVDGKGVSIIILLVSPADQTGPHIQALAKISRLMLDEEFRSKLRNSESAEEAFELLSNREQK